MKDITEKSAVNKILEKAQASQQRKIRCEKGSPCIYNSKFELVTKKESILTCGQHLNYFLDKIYTENPDEPVVVRLV